MALFKATDKGNIRMTDEEEAEFVAGQAANNSLPNRKANLRERINNEKKNRDSEGVIVNGVKYSTDFNSRLQLANAMVFLSRNPVGLATLEDKNGEIVQLDAFALGAVYDAVNAYMDSVAMAKKAHFDAIKLLKLSDIENYDINSLWP